MATITTKTGKRDRSTRRNGMTLENERPHNLMEALCVVRDSGKCELMDRSCVAELLYVANLSGAIMPDGTVDE